MELVENIDHIFGVIDEVDDDNNNVRQYCGASAY